MVTKYLIADVELAFIKQVTKPRWSMDNGDKVELGQDQTLKSEKD